jgi:serine/threonine protein phosphatase PrpC
LASKEVVRVVLQEVQDKQHQLKSVPKVQRSTIKLDEVVSPGDVLRKAILQANQVLVSTRKAVSSDRGTTITAALIVGNMCAIANVGDSRTYIMRGGKLEQVTQDHSLVAKLLAANLIKPEEVRTHPNRNQIYRTLGDKPQVDVDIFSRTLQAGDRLLLCSDGLWEMVLDKDIEKIMRQASD